MSYGSLLTTGYTFSVDLSISHFPTSRKLCLLSSCTCTLTRSPRDSGSGLKLLENAALSKTARFLKPVRQRQLQSEEKHDWRCEEGDLGKGERERAVVLSSSPQMPHTLARSRYAILEVNRARALNKCGR